jgi:rhodanese-related sulfurtransferase
MMKRRLIILIAVISVGMGMFATSPMAKDVTMITKDEFKDMLGDPDLFVIDVRYDKHWMASDMKIRGAVRENYNDVKSWAHKYPKEKHIVLYCA